MKLHLGCGGFYYEGYVNIDKYASGRFKVDRELDCNIPLDYPDGSAEEILLIHSFEHLKKETLKNVVKSWHRVLKPGGRLILELPNLLIIFHEYMDAAINGTLKDSDEILKWVFGNQEHDGQYHFWGWSPPTLTAFLREIGFKAIAILPSQDDTRQKEYSFRVEATK